MIVTVNDKDSIFHGRQGELIARSMDGKSAYIVFPPEQKGVKVVDLISLDRLIQNPEGWSAENRVMMLHYNKGYHTISYFTEFIDPKKECMREGCGGRREIEAHINIWGTVCLYHVCINCYMLFHGWRADCLPPKDSDKPEIWLRE